jgi:catechol 2,3-dioxygenase-like lactoylglutathione lyase family enzyme
MIGRLNHVAIAVPDLQAASAQYETTLGAKVGPPQDEPEHGVTVVFVELPNTKIELLYPLGEASPIQSLPYANPKNKNTPNKYTKQTPPNKKHQTNTTKRTPLNTHH